MIGWNDLSCLRCFKSLASQKGLWILLGAHFPITGSRLLLMGSSLDFLNHLEGLNREILYLEPYFFLLRRCSVEVFLSYSIVGYAKDTIPQDHRDAPAVPDRTLNRNIPRAASSPAVLNRSISRLVRCVLTGQPAKESAG